MSKSLTWLIPSCALALFLAGCATPAPTPEPGPQAGSPRERTEGARPGTHDVDFASALDGRERAELEGGGRETVPVIQVDVYVLTVPLGAVSRSEEFWKRVDENRVDVATYDLLLKNGLRVGVARSGEWDYFRGIIGEHPAHSKRSSLAGGNSGSMELPMKRGVESQNIFYLDDRNVLYGRTYEKCDNVLTVEFKPVPRRPDEVRLAVCPMVRGLRKRFEVNVLDNEEREIKYVSPERLFDLNLVADVPLGHFLVVAPSTLAEWPTSLGHTFLLREGNAEMFEQVLLLVPRVMGQLRERGGE